MMMAMLLLAAMTVGQNADQNTGSKSDRLPPLSKAQTTKLRLLVRDSMQKDAELREQLRGKQSQLKAEYVKYELDEKRIEALHGEILELQRKLLLNYRELQIQLRATVSAERFQHLKKRIDNALQKTRGSGTTSKKDPSPKGSTDRVRRNQTTKDKQTGK